MSRVAPVQTAMRNCTRDEGRSFEVGRRIVSIAPDVLGGTPVFKGTRIPVHEIADMLANGDNPAAIVKAYPQLDRDRVRLAATYAVAHPRRGRPRTKTGWRSRRPKASETIASSAVVRA